MNTKPKLNIVWLKRDLRLQDNEAIYKAIKTKTKFLIVYVFETFLLDDDHYSQRHWNFIKQSLKDLNLRLESHQSKLLVVKESVTSLLTVLQKEYKIDTLFSHQETGIKITFERDLLVKKFCNSNGIEWLENINNGVFRGFKNREKWMSMCNSYYATNPLPFSPNKNQLLKTEEVEKIESLFTKFSLNTSKSSSFQYGGRTTGLRYLKSFFDDRYKNYMLHISKPELARKGCSRLSPYIAWGNLSIREVYHQAYHLRKNTEHKRALDGFMSRLRWQGHFIQKFEMEHTMEHESINKGFHTLNKPVSLAFQSAWKTGHTGFPMVDAAMRCLNKTGYLNFRMRALVVSFFTHNLWQPWQDASKHLAQMFLDFEPGIHYPQLQMQAGETGINMLRIYNPVKNSLKHDPEATFIKKWIPELAKLETRFIHQPELMTMMEQQLFNFELGKDYPYPIVNLENTRKKASDTLWSMKNNKLVKMERERILKKHIAPKANI